MTSRRACDARQPVDALGVCGGDCALTPMGRHLRRRGRLHGHLTLAACATALVKPFECGCDDIADGACDCAGNQLDALGVCGGDCAADTDGNGICDDAETAGCTDAEACNFNASATNDDGSCEFESCAGCTSSGACNYDATATIDDGSCATLDACGECGGDGIPAGDCDCDGNQEDALGYVAENVKEMLIPMAFATTKTIALGKSTNAANVAAMDPQQALIAMEILSAISAPQNAWLWTLNSKIKCSTAKKI